jgi:hypothetical protein
MKKEKKTRSTVRHTRAIAVDRQKRPIVDNITSEVEDIFRSIVHPLTLSQCDLFHSMGLRERTLTLPVMVALLLSAIWRQITGTSELARLIHNEAVLWEQPRKVSQSALSQRLNTLSSPLFLAILEPLLVIMQKRWQERKRPLPPEIAWAQQKYEECLLVDGSTLDALLKKVDHPHA